jgi:PAS domain S-box-containing protein
MSSGITGSDNNFERKKPPVGLYMLAALSALIVIGSMTAIYWMGNKMVATYNPQIDAAMEIKLEATRAHLWLEEVVSGDPDESAEEVWKFFDSSMWYTNALLNGDKNEEGIFIPLKKEQNRQTVRNIQDHLTQFKKLAEIRLEKPEESAPGSEIDKQFDKTYRLLMAQSDALETIIQKNMTAYLKTFHVIQVTLITISIVLIVFVVSTFAFFIQRHLKDEQNLQANNQQLQAGEQQLRASNQQLQAGEQQLRASNQQLQANEQQLRVTNQQLQAGEQQLRASNQQLEAKENEYRLLFNEMTTGLAVHEIICDDNGKPCDYRFLDINPAFENLTGLKREHAIGKTIRQIMPKIDDFWIDTYGNVALTGTPTRFEHYARELQKYFDVAAYMPKKGQFAVVFTDITNKKNAEKELEQLNKTINSRNKELQSIVYISSHDLRSPLVNIQGFGGELQEHCNDLCKLINNSNVDEVLKKDITCIIESDIPEALQFISAGTRKMQILLDGLLSVSRIGTIEFDMQKLNMNELINTVISTMQFQIDEIEASVTIENLPDCTGDSNQINQVFSNLINNAS